MMKLLCSGSVLLAVVLSTSISLAVCPAGDLNDDCQVNLLDLRILAEHWLSSAATANLNDDTIVNLSDFQLLSADWLEKVQPVIISEFLADNSNILLDEENQSSDWIELFNRSPVPVSLLGWYLTDDDDQLQKWTFPDVRIAPGEFLIVFASGNDRRNPLVPLHTNFSLAAEGEYLALVEPDGVTIAGEYKSDFPQQFPNISYGLSFTGQTDYLISDGSACRFVVPENSSQITGDWAARDFNDTAWSSGLLGVGYDAGTWGTVWENMALGKLATQTSNYSASYPASNAVDGIYNNFSHTAGTDTNSTWQVNLGSDYYISSIVLYNRTGCCWSRLRDITVTIRDWQDTQDLFVSDLLNPEDILLGPMTLEVDIQALTGSVIRGGIVKVHRTPDPDLSGTGGVGSDSDRNALTLAEVEVWGSSEPVNLYGEIIRTNVENEMQHHNSSVFLRIPFEVTDKTLYHFMELGVRYDDGFSVYLNGVPVASRNAPTGLTWDSAATAEHPKLQAIEYEPINLTSYLSLLRNGTNVLAVQGLNVSSGDDDFLFDAELRASGTNIGAVGYLETPTPHELNGAEVFQMVADTKFNVNRGYHEEPFDESITTNTEGAVVYYTTDGSLPSPANGIVYSGPIRITKTTCLRAIACKPGYLSTNVDTQTYIFLNDVMAQSTGPEGFPTTWTTYTGANYAADYEMDPDIINPILSSDPNLLKNALLSLPVLSLVTDPGNLFDPTYGIYANSGEFAYELPDGTMKWEVPVSVEYFDPAAGRDMQADCGLRIQGAYFRKPGSTPKHSFRLLFKRMYGLPKLNFNLFEYDDDAADRFDTIVLRAQGNDGYSWASMGGNSQYVRDEFSRRVQAAAGHASSHGIFVHLYLNGLYWGLYNPVERPDSSFCASYYGGEKEDWDVFKHSRLDLNEGTRDAVTAMQALFQYDTPLSSVVISDSDYWKLQGCNPDGTRNSEFPVLLDVDNLIDYMLVNFWTGNQDWCWNDNNYWMGRLRVGDSTGFKFFCWDTEDNIDSPRSPVTLDMINKVYINDNHTTKPTIARLHNRLISNAEYRLRFADHVHRHLFNGGLMTAGPARTLYTELADRVESAILLESARWGDQHSATPWTQLHWINERDYILDTYFAQRTPNVLNQLKAKNLYPDIPAPVYSINGGYQHGGPVASGVTLVMEIPIEPSYTLIEIIPEGASVRVHIPVDDSLGLAWTENSFIVPGAGWTNGLSGSAVGYERSSGYETLIQTDVESIMYGQSTSAFCRFEFYTSNPAAIGELELHTKYDDGFIAYLNGAEVCRSTNIANDVPGSAAADSHQAGSGYEVFNVTPFKSRLRIGTNVLAVHGINSDAQDSDFLVLPKLVALIPDPVPPPDPVWYTMDGSDPRQFGGEAADTAIEYTGPITLTKSQCIKARTLSESGWSALNEAVYSVGPVADNLRITEVMFNPANDPNSEYIELKNIGPESVNLNLVRFTKGIDFTFGDRVISPNEYLVLVRNESAFNTAYPGLSGVIAGTYTGALNDGGEKIRLKDAVDAVVHDFEYSDGWYDLTDGSGFSLTIKDETNPDLTLWDQKAGWRPSAVSGGSPGAGDAGILPPLEAIVINEVLAHSHATQPDWIELHNTTANDINIGGWFLSDSNADGPNIMKYEIALDTVIPGNGYLVLYQDQDFGNTNDPGCHVPFALSEGGETVYLHSGVGGVLTGYVEEESFDASESGVAFGRYYKASTDSYNFVAMSSNTPWQANAYPKVGPVVISEIMYNPPAGGVYDHDEYEYIELRNISDSTVFLQEYDALQGINVPWKLSDGIDYTFPLGVSIPSGGSIVVVNNLAAFSARYPSVPAGRIYGPYDGKLSNGGEKVDLAKPGDEEAGVRYYIRLDRVNYSDGTAIGDLWPTAADGLGSSLDRIDDALYGNDVANWQAAAPTPGS